MPFNYKEYQKIQGFIDNNVKNQCKIIAVSKNHPISSVLEALASGIRVFGENRVQEAQEKFADIKENYTNIELHLTGPLQTNKVKAALRIFNIFQTLDREKLALEFSKHEELIKNKKFFIQVNTGSEASKSGVLISEVNEFIVFCQKKLMLSIVGLMCIPPIDDNPKDHFLILKNIANKNKLLQLSMGMSGDYEAAVLGGATCIRIGTKIFGHRYAK